MIFIIACKSIIYNILKNLHYFFITFQLAAMEKIT